MANETLITDTIEFGFVTMGKKLKKYYTIQNNENYKVKFHVTKPTVVQAAAFAVFDYYVNEGDLQPHETKTLAFVYTPFVSGNQSLVYCNIYFNDLHVYKLCLKGECVGPRVQCTIQQHIFYQTANKHQRELRFKLSNNSPVPASYQFDETEEEPNIFQVQVPKGTIRANYHVYVTVTFTPKKPGIYFKQLTCLLFQKAPILIDLLGINCPSEPYEPLKFKRHSLKVTETSSFREYFLDTVNVTPYPPAVSLTQTYLVFAHETPNNCKILTTSFTNHMDNEVKVAWENSKYFTIYPEQLTVPARSSVLYELRFKPVEMDRFFLGLLRGNVYWTRDGEEDMVPVPLPVTLRLIGHSFEDKQPWIPTIKVTPSPVILPVTVPKSSTFGTFVIKTRGHEAIMFRLVPPANSIFLMKPMVGIIRDFQIIAVQTEILDPNPRYYSEQWFIEVNGQADRLVPIIIKACVELPKILVGSNNVVKFDAVSPGCQDFISVPMKNISYIHIRFRFDGADEFGMEPVSGELSPNEEIITKWTCFPSVAETKQYETMCKIEGYSKCADIEGTARLETPIIVEITCIYSELCALPKLHDLGTIEYGTEHQINFFVNNLGESAVMYGLDFDCGMEAKIVEMSISPNLGKCNPKQQILTQVTCKVSKTGKNRIWIKYKNRMSEDVVSSNKSSPIELVEICYYCVYALLQITDIVDHSFGALFSKHELWDYFRVDDMNAAFMDLQSGETGALFITAPEHELDPTAKGSVTFLVENKGDFDTSLTMLRHKNCDCKLQEIQISFSLRKKVYNCPHREAFDVTLSTTSIPLDSSLLMMFHVCYNLPAETMMTYSLHFSSQRQISLNASIVTISPARPILSLYNLDYRFDFKSVYIGLKEPPIHSFWMLNNTSDRIAFRINESPVNRYNVINGYKIFVYLNRAGYLEPFTKAPLLFKFCPLEVKEYNLTTDLMLGKRYVKIILVGNGTDEIVQYTNLTEKPKGIPVSNGIISVSRDTIHLEPIIVSDSKEEMLFITNETKSDTIQYSWSADYVDGLVEIEFLNNDISLLKPKESHSVVVKVKSLCEPCIVRLFIVLTMINYEKLLTYEEFVAQKIEEGDRLETACSIDSVCTMASIRPPKNYQIIIPIQIYVVGALDKDNCLSVPYQMAQKPYDEVALNLRPMIRRYFKAAAVKEKVINPENVRKPRESELEEEIDVEMSREVLESILADAVFSDYFMQQVLELKSEPSPLYQQVRLKDPNTARNVKLIQAFSRQLHLPQLSDIFGQVIVDGLHEAFRLGPVLKSASALFTDDGDE